MPIRIGWWFVAMAVALWFTAPAAAEFPGRNKIVSPELLAGGDPDTPTRAMILLAPPAGSRTVTAEARKAAEARFDPATARVTRRFANLPVLTVEATRSGLRALAALDEVAAIQAIGLRRRQTRQGLAQMAATRYRGEWSGQGVAVAIVDTGIDYFHPALGGAKMPNGKVIGGYDFGDDDPDPYDLDGHGTACASIAAGRDVAAGDYVGGVAPDARIYALKVFPDGKPSASDEAILAAVDWCITHQHDDPTHPIMIISMSLGGGRFTQRCDLALPIYAAFMELAANRGMAIFAASGNEGYCDAMGVPACVGAAISVGAVFTSRAEQFSICFDEFSCLGQPSERCRARAEQASPGLSSHGSGHRIFQHGILPGSSGPIGMHQGRRAAGRL